MGVCVCVNVKNNMFPVRTKKNKAELFMLLTFEVKSYIYIYKNAMYKNIFLIKKNTVKLVHTT